MTNPMHTPERHDVARSTTRNNAIVTRKRFMFCGLQGIYHASPTNEYTTRKRGHVPSQAYAPTTRHFKNIYAHYRENWHCCQCMRSESTSLVHTLRRLLLVRTLLRRLLMSGLPVGARERGGLAVPKASSQKSWESADPVQI